jgi:CheY-like chemotaxis protein
MTRRLLWTDDNDPSQFVYESHILRRDGWEIRWAADVQEGAALLRDEPFDALVLDQHMPFDLTHSSADPRPLLIWGGCLMLWWLRSQRWPDEAPFAPTIASSPIWSWRPMADNARIPVIMVSAYYDEGVESIIQSASPLDQDLEILTKPLRLPDLQDFLSHIPGGAP